MKKRTDILLLLPSLLGFAAFLIIPFVYSFYYAFTESAFSHKFVWFDNFKMLIESKYFRLAFKNTMTFTAVTVPLIMVLSVVVSMVLVQYAMKLPALFLPVLLPSAAIVMFWQAYFNDMQPFQSLVLFFLWKYAGLNIMLIMTALLTVPKETLESAQLDGAWIVRRTWSLILPLISPTLFFTFIIVMMMPFQVTLLPQYMASKAANTYDTFLAVLIPAVFSPFAVFLITQMMKTIPNEYIEAARLDTGSTLRILWHIIIPVMRTGILCTFVLVFTENWNMVDQPLVLTETFARYPLTVVIAKLAATADAGTLAASVVIMIPPLLLYLFFKDEITEGLAAYRLN